ncbi:MAG TPA: glycosyltransferase family 4 protein [Firmicutes bacterium]|nr:glycosyltransferase family 4 protein [Candidatus Fermentithermobacillaceae bacterium]
MKLKIAFFSDSFRQNLGGLTRAVTGLHDALVSQGHQVTVFTLPQKSAIHRGKVVLVPAFPLSWLPGIPPDSYFGYGYTKVVKALQAAKPDIVHVHTIYPVGWIGLLASAQLQIPSIATYHANIMAGPSVLLQRSANLRKRHPKRPANLDTSGAFFHPAKNLAEKAISALARSFYNRFTAVIAPSVFAADSLQSFGITVPIHVIPSGIDTRRFSPSPSRPDFDGPCNVLYAGRLSAEKGVRTLVRVIKMLEDGREGGTSAGLPGTGASADGRKDFRFTIAGDGPLRKELEDDLGALTRQGTVEFRGFVPWDRMPAEYRKAQVFFFPSPSETQGLAVLEAMASGLPVVAVRAGAIPEFLEDGETGFLFEPENIEGVCNAIRDLAVNPELRRYMGEKARAAALRFDWYELVGRFTQLYTQFLS